MLKQMDFDHLLENVKKLFGAGLDALKTASKKLVHKTGIFTVNKIMNAVAKSNDDKIVKQDPVKEMMISLEKRDKILNDLR